MHLITSGFSGSVLKGESLHECYNEAYANKNAAHNKQLKLSEIGWLGVARTSSVCIGYMRNFVGLPVYVRL